MKTPTDRCGPLLACFLLQLICAERLAAQDMSQYYTVQHPQEFTEDFTHDLYVKGNEETAKTRNEFPHHLDLEYGHDVKQRLDLYLPKEKVKNAPVLIFIHGGGFLEGDRSHYGFIARPYVLRGVITAIIGYRLTGAGFIYPSQEDDVKNAIIWLHQHVGSYGGDPNSIFVTGHSAGAVLSGEIGVDLSWLKRAGIQERIVKGIAPVSGPYDLRGNSELSNYVPTLKLAQLASPILHIKSPVPIAVIAYGTNNAEEDSFSPSARMFADRLRAAGTEVTVVVLKGSGHIATAMALGTVGSPLSEAVLEMIKAQTN